MRLLAERRHGLLFFDYLTRLDASALHYCPSLTARSTLLSADVGIGVPAPLICHYSPLLPSTLHRGCLPISSLLLCCLTCRFPAPLFVLLRHAFRGASFPRFNLVPFAFPIAPSPSALGLFLVCPSCVAVCVVCFRVSLLSCLLLHSPLFCFCT